MTAVMFAGSHWGWEVIVVLAIVLLLFGGKELPGLARLLGDWIRGFGRGLGEFRKATDDVGRDLGESIGGIAGRPVADALTVSNETAEDTSQPAFHFEFKLKEFLNRLIVWIAQGFGIGRIPFAPGTWGSVVGVGWFLLLLEFRTEGVFLAGTVLALGFAVWVCDEAERVLGQRDPSSVVIDEIVAVPICFIGFLLAAPANGESTLLLQFISEHKFLALVTAFILFRLFDIWKPWPIRQSQRLPGGWGIVIDDALAAVYVNVVLAGGWWAWNAFAR